MASEAYRPLGATRRTGYEQVPKSVAVLETTVRPGVANSRVKDFCDGACLARRFAFDGDLRTAIAETFRRRGTSFAGERPVALLPYYYDDTARAQHWQAFTQAWPAGGALADGDSGSDGRRRR